MTNKPSFHSLCRWTFNSGKGGFTPANMRPEWNSKTFDTVNCIQLIAEKIKPRLPAHIQLGLEMHYDYEYNESNSAEIADALKENGIHLAMTTPGMSWHWGYGGIASLDKKERKAAEDFSLKAIDLTYSKLKKSWHPDVPPTLVIWNGSFGYDMGTVGIQKMYANLKESFARLVKFEENLGGKLFWGLEPKPNEGHPALLLPTVASAIVFWYKLKEQYGISLNKKGINKEFGHSEMIGLDSILDTVEELDNGMMTHVHLNSQGYNDGIILGGPGKYDIDHGCRVNGFNITIARLMQDAGYNRWKGHDMQPRPYDNEEQAIDRVVRSILSWEACDAVAKKLDAVKLMKHLAQRETVKAEDMMMMAVNEAQKYFLETY